MSTGEAPGGEEFLAQKEGQLADARMATLVRLVDYAHRNDIGGLALVLLVLELELLDELRQLAGGDQERHRRIDLALELIELKDRAARAARA